MHAPTPTAIAAYYQGLRPFWHPVLPAADLPDRQPRGVELLEEPIVLARLDGRIVALQDLCRHFQTRLSLGSIERVGVPAERSHDGGDCLRCPYHGWAYNAAGRCVEIPQLAPGRQIPSEARVPTYLAQQRHGLIWVCLAPEPHFDLPGFPELDDSAFRPGPLRTYAPWAASAPRIIMGALDDTHFPWVHEGLLGDRSHTAPPDHQVQRDGRHLCAAYTVLQPGNVTLGNDDQSTQAAQAVTYTIRLAMPTTIHLLKDSGPAGRYAIWLATCPRRYNLTDTFWRVARNYDLDPTHDQAYEDFEDLVREQDRPIVESQRPWLLPPLWSKVELPLRPADLPLIEYQRWLDELGIGIAV